MCYKELRNLLTRLSSVVRNGSSNRNQLLPTRPDDSGVAAGNVPAFISAEYWPSGSPDLNPLDYKLWAVLEDVACRKRHNNVDSLKRSPWSGRSVSRLASGQRAAILSDIIINKNLKLLIINYLARKVDVLFHFPSGSQHTCDRTYGRTVQFPPPPSRTALSHLQLQLEVCRTVNIYTVVVWVMTPYSGADLCETAIIITQNINTFYRLVNMESHALYMRFINTVVITHF